MLFSVLQPGEIEGMAFKLFLVSGASPVQGIGQDIKLIFILSNLLCWLKSALLENLEEHRSSGKLNERQA